MISVFSLLSGMKLWAAFAQTMVRTLATLAMNSCNTCHELLPHPSVRKKLQTINAKEPHSCKIGSFRIFYNRNLI
ncbi:hypothetical protein KC19_9G008800 [Ceratodon purpureus]|uniref:Secreted protein n=1 Tax=Ceratodon purpureus TaxID=3225 RepID=A0A8T0GP82_CERPU|nr:hypothetical protein KC19_9G008800 [Ceratodon purpureus]